MFGTTLEEVMDLQKEKFPTHELPWVVTILTDTVLQLSGPKTEGIFRYSCPMLMAGALYTCV